MRTQFTSTYYCLLNPRSTVADLANEIYGLSGRIERLNHALSTCVKNTSPKSKYQFYSIQLDCCQKIFDIAQKTIKPYLNIETPIAFNNEKFIKIVEESQLSPLLTKFKANESLNAFESIQILPDVKQCTYLNTSYNINLPQNNIGKVINLPKVKTDLLKRASDLGFTYCNQVRIHNAFYKASNQQANLNFCGLFLQLKQVKANSSFLKNEFQKTISKLLLITPSQSCRLFSFLNQKQLIRSEGDYYIIASYKFFYELLGLKMSSYLVFSVPEYSEKIVRQVTLLRYAENKLKNRPSSGLKVHGSGQVDIFLTVNECCFALGYSSASSGAKYLKELGTFDGVSLKQTHSIIIPDYDWDNKEQAKLFNQLKKEDPKLLEVSYLPGDRLAKNQPKPSIIRYNPSVISITKDCIYSSLFN